ncbi:DUF3280 domain-containing protein [Paraburkholderia humisilvae]|uniref:DUF2380 domain-containing protein n=1 Tax=Paraburkholderia humisilvae TaxID=627669 RepID=A0A6J5DU94_9BURK|nr:DUF3280 domain-containing protein [Paraburkholderia humisilvae]CAB3756911.1 hypothetical protein LMG29542_02944 [Paraburkholderia humisilvae]
MTAVRNEAPRFATPARVRGVALIIGIAWAALFIGTDARAADTDTDTTKSIAVMDCALIDDNAAYNDTATVQQDAARIRMVSDALRSELNRRALYRVTDNAPAGALIARLQASQNLNACNGCELEIGRKLNVERVGVCWVQKISNLILNINLRIEDVATGQTVFQRSVDMRGNTDRSWRRGATALVDLLAGSRDVAH